MPGFLSTVSFKHCAGCKPVNKKCHQTDNKANQPKFAERPEFGVEFIFQKALQKHNSGKDDDEQILQAVSYTHLDVYKRQLYALLVDIYMNS